MILLILFYIIDVSSVRLANSRGMADIIDPAQASAVLFRQIHWNDMFLNAFSFGQMIYLFIALLVGIGTIANDNRANALLVYLSKPCTKLDYVIGKWLGIFIPMVIAVAIPTFFFYSYCFMSYRSTGFLSDPWLILKLAAMTTVPAAVHASLALGISSLFKRGGLAGATYSGLYFITYFITTAIYFVRADMVPSARNLSAVNGLYYCSVDGLQIGAAKAILGTSGGPTIPLLPGPEASAAAMADIVPAPNGMTIAVILLLICSLSVLIAWTRVKAVEVVG
jgi:ABC-2 type transport system permease protein